MFQTNPRFPVFFFLSEIRFFEICGLMCGGTSISGPFTNFDLNFFQNITTFKVWTKSATHFRHTDVHDYADCKCPDKRYGHWVWSRCIFEIYFDLLNERGYRYSQKCLSKPFHGAQPTKKEIFQEFFFKISKNLHFCGDQGRRWPKYALLK